MNSSEEVEASTSIYPLISDQHLLQITQAEPAARTKTSNQKEKLKRLIGSFPCGVRELL
jgi:hypothetical protein